jgi:hypothetical protein
MVALSLSFADEVIEEVRLLPHRCCCICSQPLLAQTRHADAYQQSRVTEVKRT